MKRVILIDDDPLNVYLNSILLKETWKGAEFLSFRTAEEALDHFAQDTFVVPDLILLDINLPGLEFSGGVGREGNRYFRPPADTAKLLYKSMGSGEN